MDLDRLWDRVTEETGTTYNITKADLNLLPCPVYGRVIFSGLQLASFRAGCAAAFLQKKAQASAHARLTFSYASINWLQSLLASTRGANPSCKYGVLTMAGLKNDVPSLCRLLIYLVGLAWMQVLLAERLDILERASHQKYYSSCLRKCIWVQGFGVTAAAPLLVVWEMRDLLFPTAGLTAVFAGIIFATLSFLCNVGASMLAIGSFVRCFQRLRSVLHFAAKSEATPVAAKSSLVRARRLAALQATGVSCSLVLSILVGPIVLALAAGIVFLGPLAWASFLLQFFDVLGNAAAVLLLSGSHRLPEGDSQPGLESQETRCCTCRSRPRAVPQRRLHGVPLGKRQLKSFHCGA